MTVLGLDIATRTGWALSEGGRCGALNLPQDHTIACGRLYGALCDLLAYTKPSLVICEAPITMRGLNAKLVKLRGVAEAACYAHGVRVGQVAPSALKRWATGDGAAPKARMVEAARGWGYAIPEGCDDEADAALLAQWGAALLAGRIQIQAPRKKAGRGRAFPKGWPSLWTPFWKAFKADAFPQSKISPPGLSAPGDHIFMENPTMSDEEKGPMIWVSTRLPEIWSKMTLAQSGAYITLIMQSGLQEPKCTLPNDEEELRKLAGASEQEWPKVRKAALKGWKLRPDGRLENPVVQSKAPWEE